MRRFRSGHRERSLFPSGLACLVAAVLLLTACQDQRHAAEQREPRSVAVSPVQPTSTQRYLLATGTAKAVNGIGLVARVGGAVRSIDYVDGAEVKAGQRLFLIEPDPYQAQVQQAEASVAQARATLDNAEKQLDRQRQLLQTRVTAWANVDNAVTARDGAKAQLDAAEATLKQARLNLGYTVVTAPFDGFVTEHQVDVGAVVTPGTALATILRLDPIHVAFTVPDADFADLRAQARQRGLKRADLENVTVDVGTRIDDGYPYRGRLDYAAPEIGSSTGSLAARAILDNPRRDFLPGMFVRIRIPVETIDDAFLVPPSAIGTDQEGRFVLAVNGDNVVERRAVSLLGGNGPSQLVRGSLGAGDRVVRNVAGGIRVGETVALKAGPVSPLAVVPAVK